MKKGSLFLGLLFCLAGLLLLIMPGFVIKVLVILFGIEAIANGIYGLIYMRRLIPDSSFQSTVVTRSMLSILIGLLAVFLPLKFAQTMWTIMLFTLAIYMIIVALMEMYLLGKLRTTSVERKPFIFEAIISIVVAILMFIIGAKNGAVFVRIVGALILLAGSLFLFLLWKNRPIVQEPVEVVDDISGTIEKPGE